jgi:hypothetical protein
MPAILDWMVWDKLEVLTLCLENERNWGRRTDSFPLLALAAIKTDLIGFDFRGDDIGSGRAQC